MYENIELKYSIDTERPNRGWIVNKLQALIGEKEIGYLKVAYITNENFKSTYKSIMDYKTKIDGWCGYKDKPGYDYHKHSIIDFYTKEELCGLQSYCWYNQRTSYDEFIAYIEDRFGLAFKRFQYHLVDNPYVDYINVEPKYQRQGVGTQMYVEANKHLKDIGLKLRASTCQTDCAKNAWNKMLNDGKAVLRMLPKKMVYYQKLNSVPVMV